MSDGEQKLRVAMATAYPRENTITGGVEGVAAALAGGLAKAPGVEVHVVTCVPGLEGSAERQTSAGVTIHSVPSPGRLAWLIGYPIEARHIRRRLRDIDPDIVHCQAQTLYPYAALERGWPSLMTVHGLYLREVPLMRGWRRFQGAMLKRFERDALRRAKHVVCISPYVTKSAGELLQGKDIRFIDNPVDDRYFDVTGDGEPERILYGGTIIGRKNLLGLLDAIKLLYTTRPNIRLRVAGTGRVEPDYYQQCVDFVKSNGLERNVDFLGGISIDAMLDELSKAAMLVLPAFQETAPLIISEAQAAGRPVVATPAGGTADMVEHGKAGMIVPFGDCQALAESIGTLLGDGGLRRRMGEHARQEAGKRYRLSVVVEKTLQFYADILAEAGR